MTTGVERHHCASTCRWPPRALLSQPACAGESEPEGAALTHTVYQKVPEGREEGAGEDG